MKTKKIIAGSLAALSLFSAVCTSNFGFESNLSNTTVVEAAATGRLFNQWGSPYSKKDTTIHTQLYNAGCGIFALGNAVYNLNGNKIDVEAVAKWARDTDKSWYPGNGGLYRNNFYDKANDNNNTTVADKYGATYNFKIDKCVWGNVKNSNLVNHLKNGGVAVAHVSGHFIAITSYNSKTGQYYVVESAVNSSSRGLSAAGWVSASKLSSGKTNVDWFCLISNRKTTVLPPVTTAPVTTAPVIIQPGNCFPKYTGSSTSIVNALSSLGIDSSYSYRSKIAAANSISNYSGTADQNTKMLNLLKQGKLIKP